MPLEQDHIFEHYRRRRQNTSVGWRDDPAAWPLSGIQLALRIQPGERVLDVGCANNVFKDRIPGVVGVDPAFEAADHQCRIEDFYPEQPFDVAFALSVFNWGTHTDIEQQISATVRCLKPKSRIYLRLAENARGGGRSSSLCKNKYSSPQSFIDDDRCRPYHWTFHRVYWWAERFGYQVTELTWDYNPYADRKRIFAEWRRESGT